jgi:hypothetical protein
MFRERAYKPPEGTPEIKLTPIRYRKRISQVVKLTDDPNGS